MPGNSIGNIFRLTTFGESHGPATGGIIDGCPAGLGLDHEFIRQEIERRQPLYPGSTPRSEADTVEWLAGIRDDLTLGTPIAFQVRNQNVQSADYAEISDFYRPSHADYTYGKKFGIRDGRGGGRASGRETLARVVAGAVAKLLLRESNMTIRASICKVGHLVMPSFPVGSDPQNASSSGLILTDPSREAEILNLIGQMKESGNTVGGSISCIISGLVPGLGEPVFDKMQSALAAAMLSIGTARAFEFGMGFEAAGMTGKEHNDQMEMRDGRIAFLTNHDGGIQGGISNGQDIYFRVGFKPVSSIHSEQRMINANGEEANIALSGRHDTCHLPRLVVVVEAMAALVLADFLLRSRLSKI
jgi:chorismate synthase